MARTVERKYPLPGWTKQIRVRSHRLGEAGGNVDLKLGADYRQKSVGILVEVVAGDNEQAVALALSQSPLLNEVTRGIKNLLTPWRKAQKLYFLPLSGTGEA